jgi:hypothetical protein
LVPYVNMNVVVWYLWWVEGVGEGHLQVEEEVASLVGAAHRATYRGLKVNGKVHHRKFQLYLMYLPNYHAYSICKYIP